MFDKRAALLSRKAKALSAVVGIYVAAAILVPLALDFDPVATSVVDRLLPPGSETSAGTTAILGTDGVGRDILWLVLRGSTVSVGIGAASLTIALLVGTSIGISAAYRGRIVDASLMRLADLQLAFPTILLAIFVVSLFGRSVLNIVVVLAITRWVVFARVSRGQTLATMNEDYVRATRAFGASAMHTVRRCIIPAAAGPLLVVGTVELGLIIVAEASLSFLGFGAPARLASWGQTIASGRDYLSSAWWIATFPGLALSGLVVAIGLLGDELRRSTSRVGSAF